MFLNNTMTSIELVEQGNNLREQNKPLEALAHYAQAMILDPNCAGAFNNYGNTLRELGQPARAVPFLQHAIAMIPDQPTFNFNLSVCQLLMGDYPAGFQQYEWRWKFEHLNGLLPNYSAPRWTGQDLNGKRILILGEQGHGDTIQFSRFLFALHQLGAKIHLQTNSALIPLFANSSILESLTEFQEPNVDYDYWSPMMSLPTGLGLTLENLPKQLGYLVAQNNLSDTWKSRLGPKYKMRIGFSWSGRRDTWINRHKSVPFEKICNLIYRNPSYEWINLQVDAEPQEEKQLADLGVRMYPGTVSNFADTAALMTHLDLVVSVDTAVSHLAGALARPTWIMLNNYAVDWRWLIERDDSPWYPSAKLFRQPEIGNWDSVIDKITWHLQYFKV